MAWGSVGTLGVVADATDNQTQLVLTTSAALEAGNVGVIVIAVDNHAAVDGYEGAVSGVVDSAGNTWTMVPGGELTNSQGAALAGSTCSVWYCKAGATLASGGAITVSFTNSTSRDASAVTAWEFTVTAGATISVEAVASSYEDNTDTGSLDVTTPNAEFLRLRAISREGSDATGQTWTSGWTALAVATTGNSGSTNHSALGEFIISTGTGAASNPTMTATTRDGVSIYVTFKEAVGVTQLAVDGLIAPVGALALQPIKLLQGSLTPTGAVVYTANKLFAGSITPSGLLTSQLAIIRSFTGEVAPQGLIVNQANINQQGSLSPTGTDTFQVNKLVAGSITPAGNLIKVVNKFFAGSIALSGALVNVLARTFESAITPISTLFKQVSVFFVGGITPTSLLLKQVNKVLTGGVTPTGQMSNAFSAFFSGVITPTSTLISLLSKLFTGVVTPTSALLKLVSTTINSSILPTAQLTKQINLTFSGNIQFSSSLLNLVTPAVQSITLTGNLTPSGYLTVAYSVAGCTFDWSDRLVLLPSNFSDQDMITIASGFNSTSITLNTSSYTESQEPLTPSGFTASNKSVLIPSEVVCE